MMAVDDEDEDEDEDLLDPLKWVERMREKKHEPEAEVVSQKKKKAAGEKADAETEFVLKHSLNLGVGESATLTLSDANVLGAEGDFVLEDVRASELQQFKRNTKTRKLIKEMQAASGPTGISSKHFSDHEDESEEEEEGKDSGYFGPRFESDEQTISSAGLTAAELSKAGQETTIDSATDAKKYAKIKKVRLAAAADDSETMAKPTVLAATFKKRKLPTKGKSTASQKIDWDDLLDLEPKAKLESVPSGPAFERPAAWGVIGEDDEAEELEGALKRASEQRQAYQPLIGGMPPAEKEEEVKEEPGLVLTAVSEFARSLQTPLERLEEKRRSGKRGLSSAAEGAKKEVIDVNAIPEVNLEVEQVLDQGGMDGGLTSALKFLKEKGDMNEDRWNLGRVGREKKVPLYKSTQDGDIKLDYVDKFGRIQNPKQAFRDMSYHFHGKQPGKRKQAKLLKKMELEKKLKSQPPEEVLPSMQALQAQQQKGQAYLVLS